MVRFKNRWFLVEFLPISSKNAAFEGKQIWNALKQCILHNFGDAGWGAVAMSLTVKYYSPTTNVCIIRVGRDQHRIAWAGLTLLTTVDGVPVIPHVVHLSGTIKHAQLAAVTHNREVIARYRRRAKTSAGYHDSYDDFLTKSDAEINSLQD
ncbi:hypothetical protein FISHEDRAFT_66541 [Fistulina hepatica ATCC 64428]|uniref:Uncharacterized protein n=1 Tax=Fistulina hepatica ATCC 64428 TaxID=1128425 RepID=A0A0D7A4T8_9AGAR|nr:hypothetical protein FISHEDRAFT_66541 [Fistulina hepatica ATCC 64428]